MVVKDYDCSTDNKYLQKKAPKLWLYVNLTDICPASCPFCVNPGKKRGNSSFDRIVFRKTLEIVSEHIYGISFTGGEPMLDPASLDAAISIAADVMGDTVEIDTVTNGINLERFLSFDSLESLYSIHISRHMIQDEDNQRLMGIETPTMAEIQSFVAKIPDPARIVLNCILQKDGVSCREQAAEYLEMASEAGIKNVSFIGLIVANRYCSDQYVDPLSMHFEEDLRFRVWNQFHDHEFCSCSSGDYKARNGWIRYYYRMPGAEGASYTRQLVYTADNKLLSGFGGTEILL